MKFLLCLALCFAAAQARLVGVQNGIAYSAPYTTYAAGAAPALYNAPLTYSAFPSAYSAGIVAPTVYNAGVASPLVRSAYVAPSVFSSSLIGATTLLKK